ncbi:hypothetical protein O988_04605 [Pseudogymnoascus sp. VKM F-3808]|nr:hypothetical protein O988_04605 [Pseudogymnoascus sp. VKM F-3808]
MAAAVDPEFPCSLVIDIPLPTERLASSALQALQVDKELSPLVCRTLTLVAPTSDASGDKTVLRTEYKASTNRMLRVAVNGFMESLSVVLSIMEELDVDGRTFFIGEAMVDAAGPSLWNSIHAGATLGIDSNNIYLLCLRSTKARSQTDPVDPQPGIKRS